MPTLRTSLINRPAALFLLCSPTQTDAKASPYSCSELDNRQQLFSVTGWQLKTFRACAGVLAGDARCLFH